MSTLTATVAKGKTLFESVVLNYITHDNASDNMVAGVYSHNALEGSATELDDIVSLALFLAALGKASGGALNVRNASGGTLNNGPVRVSGYYGDDANGFPIFKIVAADAAANTSANALLLTALADATTGVAYLSGDFTPSPALDLSAATVGDPVYLAAAGGMTRTAPTGADQAVQEIGKVKTVNATGVVAGYIKSPSVFGTSFIQPLAITNAKIAAATIDLTTKVTGILPVANGGTGLATAKRIFMVKSADTIVNNSTVLVADADLVFAIGANEKWRCRFDLLFGSTENVAHFMFTVDGPASPNKVRMINDGTWFNSGLSDDAVDVGVAYLKKQCYFNFSFTPAGGHFDVYIDNGANAGNVTLKWAQQTAVAVDCKLYAGSNGIAERLA